MFAIRAIANKPAMVLLLYVSCLVQKMTWYYAFSYGYSIIDNHQSFLAIHQQEPMYQGGSLKQNILIFQLFFKFYEI
jgi:hypothetical protein